MRSILPAACGRPGQDVATPSVRQGGNSYAEQGVPFSSLRARANGATRRDAQLRGKICPGGLARPLPSSTHRRWTMMMKTATKTRIYSAVVGLSLVSLLATACGTLGGAAVGAGAGAAVGAGTGYGAGKGALIGTGVGAAAGAIYDITKH
jgi:hypothetical protein